MSNSRIFRCVCTALLTCSAACGRDTKPAVPAAQDATTSSAPTRTALLGNLGPYRRAIRTRNAQSQQFFDEGLTLLYGFNHEEAFA